MADPKSGDKPRVDPVAEKSDQAVSDRVFIGDQSAHLAFQKQLAEMLSRADVTEEQRQQILIAATCPCCGAGGLSLSINIKKDETPQF